MDGQRPTNQWRRVIMRVLLAIPLAYVLSACSAQATSTATPTLVPTQLPTSAPAPTSAPILTPIPEATVTIETSPTTIPASPTAMLSETPTQSVQAQAAVATPACDPKNATIAQTEGPYYKANTPEKSSLLDPGMTGTQLVVTGYVLDTDCKPVAHAMLDFWQADDHGVYDNTGYRLRGHLFTNAQGKYTLQTIVPGLYPGRTGHIHVKVQAPNGPVLTTQLYFPGEPSNDADSIFDPRLLMTVQNADSGEVATFNFVIRTG